MIMVLKNLLKIVSRLLEIKIISLTFYIINYLSVINHTSRVNIENKYKCMLVGIIFLITPIFSISTYIIIDIIILFEVPFVI